ncbi:MAG: baseplate assembly protein [Rhodospirillales bacterium]|nr:baseplate assembly protein [Rhodospirillales bacterium]MBR9816341.1 baseplate assembly protein [Rhodospirillales bacterium]
MTSRFDAIDLGAVPVPDIIETLEFEAILAERKAEAQAAFEAAGILPDWNPDLESDPIVKLLEQSAYREVVLRQRVNDAARAVMLAHAKGKDLENIGARYHVVRQTIEPGDATAVPPVEPVMESDPAFLTRILLAFEALSVAGPIGAYKFHARSAHPLVLDVDVVSPEPGHVVVTVMAATESGIPSEEVLDAVRNALSHDDVCPLTDMITVQAASAINYDLKAVLEVYGGPDKDVVRTASESGLNAFLAQQRRLGEPVTIDGVHKAARVDGVRKATAYRADGETAFSDIVPTNSQFPNCTGISVEVAE